MKTILAILAFVALAVAGHAQSITQSAEYPWRLQVDFTYTTGTITAAPITQFYRSDVTQGSAVIAQPSSTPSSLVVDLVANGTKTVTVNGHAITYAQVLATLQAIMAQERAAQLASH